MRILRLAGPVFALPLVACSKGHFGRPQAGTPGTLRLALPLSGVRIDPGRVVDGDGSALLRNVAEGLVAYDDQSRIAPALAERWDVSKDGLTYTFHLRQGVRFSNGRPLTADDFRWTWERNLAPSFGAPYGATYLSILRGAKAYIAGRARSIEGVTVIGPQTLRVALERPCPYFLGFLTAPVALALAREAATAQAATKAGMVVGTGPFRLVRALPDQEIVLEANSDCWRGRPKLDRVVYSVVTDAATRFLQYRNGELDMIMLSRDDVAAASKRPELKARLRFLDVPNLTYLAFGQRAFPPFRDARVRRAFFRAVDRGRIVREYLPGNRLADGLVPPGIEGFPTKGAAPTYDPAAARVELAAAGYPGGRGFPSVELDYSDFFPEWRKVAESTALDLERNLNIRVRPKQIAWAALLDRYTSGRFSFGVTGWQADYLDPQDFLSMLLRTGAPENRQGFSDPTFDALCARADVGGLPAERIDLYRKAERRALAVAAEIPLYAISYPLLVQKRVRSLRFDATGALVLREVEL